MQLKPFEIKGDAPQWSLIYDILASKQIGDIATYDELSEAIDADIRTSRAPLYKAHNELLEQKLRGIEVVKNTGYRIVQANEHQRLAKGQHKKARRRIKQAIRIVQGTDHSLLTEQERSEMNAIQLNLSRQADAIRRLENRQGRTEAAVKAVEQKVESGEDRLARLERLEEALRSKGLL